MLDAEKKIRAEEEAAARKRSEEAELRKALDKGSVEKKLDKFTKAREAARKPRLRPPDAAIRDGGGSGPWWRWRITGSKPGRPSPRHGGGDTQ